MWMNAQQILPSATFISLIPGIANTLQALYRDANSLPNVMTSTFHTHSSLVYVIWNYITGIRGLGINATDLESQRRGEP